MKELYYFVNNTSSFIKFLNLVKWGQEVTLELILVKWVLDVLPSLPSMICLDAI